MARRTPLLSAMNQLSKEMQKSANAAARERKRLEKAEILRSAQETESLYLYTIETITSHHKDCKPIVNWKSISNLPEPIKPKNSEKETKKIEYYIKNYQPSFFSKLFRLESKQLEKLNQDLILAQKKDSDNYQAEINKYNKDYETWEKNNNIANRILNKDYNAYIDYFAENNPFEKIELFAYSVQIEITENNNAIVTLREGGKEIIPENSAMVLKSGTLSVKKLPVSKYYDLYKNYVCSALYRAAREVYAILPLDGMIVNAESEIINTTTGNSEKAIILSIEIPKGSFDNLNMENIVPADALYNFKHSMKFLKTKGFQPIEPLKID